MIIVASNRAVAKLIEHGILTFAATSIEFTILAAGSVGIDINAVIFLYGYGTAFL